MGQKSAVYNAQGEIIGFYDSIDSPPIPTEVTSIKITDVQWQTCLANPGYTVQAGALVPPVPSTDAQLLATAQSMQTAKISAACQKAIYAGVTSSALGTSYTYPTDDLNQTNMAASVLASLYPGLAPGWATPFLCGDANNVWVDRLHTAAQIQQAGADVKAFIITNLLKNRMLAAQIASVINSPTAIAEVQAIVW